jgi:cytochrome c-type biogenesis protein CcmE
MHSRQIERLFAILLCAILVALGVLIYLVAGKSQVYPPGTIIQEMSSSQRVIQIPPEPGVLRAIPHD